jgi:hypothetical protein
VRYGDRPDPFLSTITSISAALVAIVGGLLIARFVTLDGDQQGATKVLAEAEERAPTARRRADDAQQRLRRREAGTF